MMDVIEKMKTKVCVGALLIFFLSCALLTINPGYKPLTALPVLVPKLNAASMV